MMICQIIKSVWLWLWPWTCISMIANSDQNHVRFISFVPKDLDRPKLVCSCIMDLYIKYHNQIITPITKIIVNSFLICVHHFWAIVHSLARLGMLIHDGNGVSYTKVRSQWHCIWPLISIIVLITLLNLCFIAYP